MQNCTVRGHYFCTNGIPTTGMPPGDKIVLIGSLYFARLIQTLFFLYMSSFLKVCILGMYFLFLSRHFKHNSVTKFFPWQLLNLALFLQWRTGMKRLLALGTEHGTEKQGVPCTMAGLAKKLFVNKRQSF